MRVVLIILTPLALVFIAALSVVAIARAVIRRDDHTIKQSWIAIDQVGNAMLGGWADVTISARAHYRQYHNNRWAVARAVIDLIFRPWQLNHCATAYKRELELSQMDPAMHIKKY